MVFSIIPSSIKSSKVPNNGCIILDDRVASKNISKSDLLGVKKISIYKHKGYTYQRVI